LCEWRITSFEAIESAGIQTTDNEKEKRKQKKSKRKKEIMQGNFKEH
jgi:hypothetical protein